MGGGEVSDKILILGASGYMGSAMVRECGQRGLEFYAAHRDPDNYETPVLFDILLKELRPALVVNCSAYIPVQSVDLCKERKRHTLEANALLPQQLASLCDDRRIPFMQLSTGCIFDERREYTEEDVPTRGFGGYCGYYVGTRLLCEELVRDYERHYIIRLRLPFDEFDSPRNYLSKLASFTKVFDHVNSLTHRGDFAKAALDLWQLKAAWGTYNVCCEGQLTARQLVLGMAARGMIQKCPEIVENETTGCRLSVVKLKAAGVKVRHVDDAMVEALDNWKKP